MNLGSHNLHATAHSCNASKAKNNNLPSQTSSGASRALHQDLNFQAWKPRTAGSQHENGKRKEGNLGPEKGKAKRSEQVQKKKQSTKKHHQKRPQTPDPSPCQKLQADSFKFAQPQVILKEIEKNVNFLKEMYFASLSHQSSLTQKHSTHVQNQSNLAQSQQSYRTAQQHLKNTHHRRSFEGVHSTKKSIPEICLNPCFQPGSQIPTRILNAKAYQQFINGHDKQTQHSQRDQGAKQKQATIRAPKMDECQAPKKSGKSLKKIHKIKEQKTQEDKRGQVKKGQHKNDESESGDDVKQKGSAINSLFEIFKYYKRSIDSSLSKRSSATDLMPRSGSAYESHKTSLHPSSKGSYQKSYGKETPNNSTSKNTTNLKSSTASRICGNSVEASADVTVEEECNKNLRVRKDSTSNSKKGRSKNKEGKKKIIPSEQGSKKGNEKQEMRAKKHQNQQDKDYKANIHAQRGKENHNTSNTNKSIKQRSKEKHKGTQASSKFKKKDITSGPACLSSPEDEIKLEKPISVHHQPKKGFYQETNEPFQFPEIQSSLFDKNMPILQEDSRQEASSELIALTSQKPESIKQSPSLTISEAKKLDHSNPESLSRKKKGDPEKESQDSLAGCEIPKRDSDSDLDNYELVSFEL